MVTLRLVALLLLVTIGTSSCTSMRPIRAASAPTAPKEFLDIKPGDHVAVKMADGRAVRFKVQRVDEDGLVAENGDRYRRTEIQELRRRQFSHAKTWSLVGGVGFGLVLMFAIAAVSAYDDLLSGR